jgi:hypothetical protein
MPKYKLSKEEHEVVQAIRHRGFAVIIWTPKELKNARPRYVEDRSIELGWEIIETLND